MPGSFILIIIILLVVVVALLFLEKGTPSRKKETQTGRVEPPTSRSTESARVTTDPFKSAVSRESQGSSGGVSEDSEVAGAGVSEGSGEPVNPFKSAVPPRD